MKSVLFLFFAFCWAGNSEAVRINFNTNDARDLTQFAWKVKSTLEKWYPFLAYRLNSPTFRHIDSISLYFNPRYNGAAYASGREIVGSVKYYRNNKNDVGSMIHEMIHVIQGYRNCPSWLAEGIADYWRYYYFDKRTPRKPSGNQKYTDGYSVTAYFLNWVETRKGQILYWLNKDCREGTYNDNIWPRLLGKSVGNLWWEMLHDHRG